MWCKWSWKIPLFLIIGPDYISLRILKTCARELVPSISVLLNKSFAPGAIPDEWKSADITPIFKKGSEHERDSYRQISLTCTTCKIGEKIVKDWIINFWNDLNVFNRHQFAIYTLNDWTETNKQFNSNWRVFLDLAKTFDSVPNERLLLKLNKYGIGRDLLVWFRNLLTNRKQRVIIRGTCSEWSPVISGTPQGTIFGPILFLLFVNDISDNVKSKIKLFADDMKMYREIKDPIIDTEILQ